MEDLILAFSPPPQSPIEHFQRVLYVSYKGFTQPENGEWISELGDLTCLRCLPELHAKMLADDEGAQILHDKPRLRDQQLLFDTLSELPANTFGHHYFAFMDKNGFSPTERPLVRQVPDLEQAYVLQRYKETHDFMHVILNLDTSVEQEIALKWFEMLQTGMPSCALASLFGPLSLSIMEREALFNDFLPFVMKSAEKCRLFVSIYFEKYFNMDMDDFRRHLNVVPWRYFN